MHFDARRAKALKPGESYAITGCPGLRLEASQTKMSWTYRYRSPVSGKLKQVRIGHWPQMPPATAVAEWGSLRARRDAGEDPATEKKQSRLLAAPDAQGGEYTLQRMVDDYHTGHLKVNRKPKGARLMLARLNRAVSEHQGLHADRAGRRFVHDFIVSLAETPTLATSVKAELAAAHDLAVNSGRLPEDTPNWWALAKIKTLASKGAMRDGKRKGRAKRTLRPEEIKLLFSGQMHLFSQQVQDFLTLQQWTCARGGEICQMRSDQLALESGVLWWTLPLEQTKIARFEAASDFRVPLVGRAREVVERLKRDNLGWLFPSKARDGTHTHVKQPYMQSKVHYRQPYSRAREDHVRERLQVTHWSPHDLRRTGRTMLAALRCPEEVAEAILGHVKPGVVGVYNLHRYDAEKVEWLAKLANRLEEITRA
jgi:integrase